MAKYLIVYGTKQGQSGKIAQAIGKELQSLGHTAQVFDAAEIPGDVQLSHFDAVIAGGGVHISGYPRALRRWVKSHTEELSSKPSAFYSVCLGILENKPEVQAAEQKIMQTFFEQTDWRPQQRVIFAGALMYSKYNWLIKRAMRYMAYKAGVETVMTRDYEYTNWDQVKGFARTVAQTLGV